MSLEILLYIAILLGLLNLILILFKNGADYSGQFEKIISDMNDHFGRAENLNKTEASNSRLELAQSLRAKPQMQGLARHPR